MNIKSSWSGRKETQLQSISPMTNLLLRQTRQTYLTCLTKSDSSLESCIDQWDLIGICCNALKKVGKDAWISSFKRVNLHPDYRVDFVELLKRIDGSRQCGERFFVKEHGSAQITTSKVPFWCYACIVEESQLRRSTCPGKYDWPISSQCRPWISNMEQGK